MIFSYKQYFLLLIPFVLILIYRFYFLNQKKENLKWSSLFVFKQIGTPLRVLLKWVPFFLQCLSVLLLILALSRPQKIDTMTQKSLEGIDIIIVLDISFSMMAEDMNPGTRLDSAKTVIQNFIDGLNSDRIGLILFSGESYTQVPLTLDYNLLKQEVSQVQTSSDISMGTAIGVAISNGVSRLRHSKSPVMILLTDGENNRGNISPETALSIAKQFKIKIYPIGVGSQGRVRVPTKYKDAFGRERTNYIMIESKMNEDLLKKIAQETGGQFYLARNKSSLNSIFEEISDLEKTKTEIKEWTRREEKYQEFLKPALLIYSISLILSLTFFGRVP